MLRVVFSSVRCIFGWLWWLWFKLCIPTNPQVRLYSPTDHVHTLRPQGSALRGKYCHISYLTSSLSSPTPTFRTYLRPLLRRYLDSTSYYPFIAMQPPLLFSPFLLPSIIPCSPIVLDCRYFRLAFLLAISAHYYSYYLSML